MVQEERLFIGISYLVLRGHHEEQPCEFILNLDQWFRRKCCLKVFLIWSSGSSFVQRSVTRLCNFGRGYEEELQPLSGPGDAF